MCPIDKSTDGNESGECSSHLLIVQLLLRGSWQDVGSWEAQACQVGETDPWDSRNLLTCSENLGSGAAT